MADSRPENTDAGHSADGACGQTLPPPEDPVGVLGDQPLVALRAPAVRRLLALWAQGGLSRRHVRLAGECLGASERTVWRWLAEASQNPAAAAHPGARRTMRLLQLRAVTGVHLTLVCYRPHLPAALHQALRTAGYAITADLQAARHPYCSIKPPKVADAVAVPVAVYQISGEYAMIEAAGEKGWAERDAATLESLTGIRRGCADDPDVLGDGGRTAARPLGPGRGRGPLQDTRP